MSVSEESPPSGPRGLVRRNPLGAFFLLAYLLSWAYWVPLALCAPGVSHFPGLLGPMLSAVIVTSASLGRPGLRDLTGRMLRWKIPVHWYGVAIIPAAAAALGVAAVALVGNDLPAFPDLSDVPGAPDTGLVPLLALLFVVNGYGEEVGWRGFAWARLRDRHGLPRAAGLLGLIWAGWHLPTFWLDTGLRGLDWFVIPGWVIGLMAGAVVLGWIYERADSSILIVALFHTMINVASSTAATTGLPAAVTAATVIVWAVAILRREQARSVKEVGT